MFSWYMNGWSKVAVFVSCLVFFLLLICNYVMSRYHCTYGYENKISLYVHQADSFHYSLTTLPLVVNFRDTCIINLQTKPYSCTIFNDIYKQYYNLHIVQLNITQHISQRKQWYLMFFSVYVVYSTQNVEGKMDFMIMLSKTTQRIWDEF